MNKIGVAGALKRTTHINNSVSLMLIAAELKTPPTSVTPVQSYFIDGDIPCSSAAAATAGLNTEPTAKAQKARFINGELLSERLFAGSFESNTGRLAQAFIAPLFGSSITTAPMSTPHSFIQSSTIC